MKIVQLIWGLGRGGAERVVCDLCDDLVALGHEVVLVSLCAVAQTRPSDSRVDLRVLGWDKSVLRAPVVVWKLVALIRSLRCDILHAHMFHSNMVARFLRLVDRRITIVNTIHCGSEGGALRDILYRRLPGCRVVTNVSEVSAAQWVARGVFGDGFQRIIHNGIDVRKFVPPAGERRVLRREFDSEGGSFLVCSVGRLERQKDHLTLLRAVALSSNASLKVLVCGEGELMARLQATACSLGVHDRCIFLGYQDNVLRVLQSCDAFVLHSLFEGFPLVLGEAMAAGLPCVSTRVEGSDEFLGSSEFLVRVGDAAGLARALDRLASLPVTERLALGGSNRERIKAQFSRELVAPNYLELYAAMRPKLQP